MKGTSGQSNRFSVYLKIRCKATRFIFSTVDIHHLYFKKLLVLQSLLLLLLLVTTCHASLPGEGKSTNPYRIESLTHFQEFANYDNAAKYWSANIYTELTTNLNLNGSLIIQAPIGGELVADQGNPGFQGSGYSGNFNGNGYTISNFSLQDFIGTESYLALFGVVNSEGVVSNLKIDTVFLKPTGSTNYMGAVAAINYGTIEKCDAVHNSTGTGSALRIGGIVGANFGLITKCSVSGELNFNLVHYLGGISGTNNADIKYSASDIILIGHTNVGGIVGSSHNAYVSDCYSLGNITAMRTSAAGIVGQSLTSTIERCYSASAVQAPFYPGEIAGMDLGTEIDCYFLDQVAVGGTNTATPLTEEQMKLADNFINWDFSDGDGDPAVWMELPDEFPKLKWQINFVSVPNVIGLELTDAEAEIRNASLTVGDILYQSSKTVPEGSVISSDPSAWLLIREGEPVNLIISSGTPYSGGDGSVHDPYLLATPSDIIELHSSPSSYSDHFLMLNNISMQGHTFHTALIAPDGGPDFSGFFDGDGHEITSMVIDTTSCTVDTYNNNYLGFFGTLASSATIKNLAVSGIVQTAGTNEYVGGLCGSNYGTITNCSSDFDIIASSYIGTICGKNQPGATIDKCFCFGSIFGNTHIGGFCGANNGGISQCFAKVYINIYNGGSFAGGFCGSSTAGSNMSNCYCLGDISCGASNDSIGGYGGEFAGTVEFCYCASRVSQASASTNIAFFANGNPTVINDCYYMNYNSDIIYNGIAQSLTAAQMRDSSSFIGWDFTNIWYMTLGNYPQIRVYDSADINQDTITNLADLAIMAGQWLVGY